MAGRRFSRGRGKLGYRLKTIIVCEGLTEFNYFHAIRIHRRVPATLLNIINPGATDPESLVRLAIEERSKYKSDGSWTSDDQAWAAFDGDEHIENDPNNWHRALDLARRKNIGLAISNPSFELWYLLHYANQTANINRTAVKHRLEQHIPGYDKAKTYYPVPLREVTNEAMQRAAELQANHQHNDLERESNPSCGVHSLMVQLNGKYLDS